MNRFLLMGIVNITPDSFSDGGCYNQVENCRRYLEYLIAEGIDYLDIGAESTAPMGQKISSEEEKRRFKDIFFPAIKDFVKISPAISIDTYRPETFLWAYEKLRENGFQGKIIWNDVGGIIDEKIIETLQHCSSADYIYTHNFVTKREEISNHMAFVREELEGDELLKEIHRCFTQGLDRLSRFVLSNRIWLDPGFGFSKNVRQNWYLSKNIEYLTKKNRKRRFLLGISRKRFLREHAGCEVELLQGLIYMVWRKKLSFKRITVRVHDFKIPKFVESHLRDLF